MTGRQYARRCHAGNLPAASVKRLAQPEIAHGPLRWDSWLLVRAPMPLPAYVLEMTQMLGATLIKER
jgi:hypothetical protein